MFCFLVGYTADHASYSNVCLGTRVRTCCPVPGPGTLPEASLFSETTVNVNGDDVTLSYYITEDEGIIHII